jgi:two-component system, sensor histidine kinase and response regulator
MIATSANILQTLVNDILNFSQLEANGVVLHPEEFNLQTTIDEVLDMCALKERNESVEIEHLFYSPIPEPTIVGDKNRLSIVIQNLVDNAIKVCYSTHSDRNTKYRTQPMALLRLKQL